MPIKCCTHCHEEKSLISFGKDKRGKGGFSSWCKACESKRAREWYTKHIKEARKTKRKWCEANPKNVLEKRKRWLSIPSNIERKRQHDNNRRFRKINNGGVITAEEWIKVKEFYNYTCLCCGRREPEIKLALDHVIPLKVGGRNVIENAQPLCKSCNSRKHTDCVDYRLERMLT